MIIPCCGESSRFPGLKKQFMIHPTGVPLPIFSASGVKGCREHIFVFLEEDFKNVYVDCRWFKAIAEKHGLQNSLVILLPTQTTSQVQTVSMAIELCVINHRSIYIKDNDNWFTTHARPVNMVNVEYINNGDFDVRNKSFSKFEDNQTGIITDIQERGIISQWINCGGYGFQSGDTFLKYSNQCSSITHVIRNIMSAGGTFEAVPVGDYKDYGTMKAWVSYLYDNYV